MFKNISWNSNWKIIFWNDWVSFNPQRICKLHCREPQHCHVKVTNIIWNAEVMVALLFRYKASPAFVRRDDEGTVSPGSQFPFNYSWSMRYVENLPDSPVLYNIIITQILQYKIFRESVGTPVQDWSWQVSIMETKISTLSSLLNQSFTENTIKRMKRMCILVSLILSRS